MPSEVYVAALAKVLQLDQRLLEQDIQRYSKSRRESRIKVDTGSIRSWPKPARAEKPDEMHELVRRREILKAGATAAATTTASGLELLLDPVINTPRSALASTAGKSYIGRPELDAFESLERHLAVNLWRYDYDRLEVQLIPLVERIAQLLNRPLRYKERGELCLYGAQISAILGIVTFERGRLRSAHAHFNDAFYLADEIGHRDLMAWIVGQESTIAVYSQQYDYAKLIAQAGKTIARGAMKADLASNEARALAGMGSAKEALRAITNTERAAEAMPRHQDSDISYYLFGFPRSMGFLRSARSFLMLGQPREAQEAARIGLELTQWNKASQQGQARLMSAIAYAQLGEVDEACRVASAAINDKPQNILLIKVLSTDLLMELEKRSGPKTMEFKGLLTGYEASMGPRKETRSTDSD